MHPPKNIDDFFDGVDSNPTLSIVVPLFNEQDNLYELATQLNKVMQELGRPFEILLVDDGSTDKTALRILKLSRRHGSIKGVYLARRYGQSTAMQAGFDVALGDIVVTLDGDLQNDPSDIPLMLKMLAETEADLVCGWRVDREDGTLRKFFSRVANRIISYFMGFTIHDYGCTLRVYRKQILKRMRLYGEMHRFIPALAAEVGGHIVELKVKHRKRIHGRSKYSLRRTGPVLLDLLFVLFMRKYLQRPLHFFGGFGLGLGALGVFTLSYLTVLKIYMGEDIGSRPLLVFGVMCVLIGCILIGQGLIFEVISRIYFTGGPQRQYFQLEKPLARKGMDIDSRVADAKKSQT